MELHKAKKDLFLVLTIFRAYTSVEMHILENMALGKHAFQSSTQSGRVADRAVDGNLSQNTYDNSCFHTENETNAYWEVDLGEMVFINHITIYTRSNLGDEFSERRLRDIEVYIGPSRNENTRLGFYEGVLPKGIIHTFHLTNTVLGQWVRLTRSESVEEHFELCEVEVYGYPSAYRVHSLNIAPSQSLSILHCAFICYKTNGCYGATFHEDTRMCEYLTSDTGVEAEDTLMLIPLG